VRSVTSLPVGMDAPFGDILATTRAIRRLRPDPVPRELLLELVRAATLAPSAVNLQAARYYVVTSRDVIAALASIWQIACDQYLETMGAVPVTGTTAAQHERFSAALRHQRDHFAQIPALIVACYDPGPMRAAIGRNRAAFARWLIRMGPRRAVSSLRWSGRTLTLTQAASVYPAVQNVLLTARALGLGATMTTWHLPHEGEVKRVIGIPRALRTYAIIPVGWPAGRLGPVRRQPPGKVMIEI
jgi:nitroreductase